MADTIATTQADYDKMVAELDDIKHVQRPAIIVDLQAARANGDLSENADYHAAKEKLAELDARIGFLEDRLMRSQIISHDTAGAETVTFGATVSVRNLATGRPMEFTLVSSDSVNPAEGRISTESPIGKALLGAKRGDKVEVKTPRGVNQFEILDYK
ncbi:MAG: transcription elongation factor GreA [Fibrobacterales bacterium]|nr:transcription elongation factor GreA [Fibrobacterales bacterium]MBP5187666.1 transcription elongation factor GreA [Fibrobacterales bacterium]MBP5350956.1 transcription elongation factor GreA [Fibrobacterales bacterium]